MRNRDYILVCLALLLLSTGASLTAQEASADLSILWAQWGPADALQDLASRYSAETGTGVQIVQEPWPGFYARAAAAWNAGDDSFDIIVGEPEWLGEAVSGGHYLDLTAFMTDEGIAASVAPESLALYAEYPAGSGVLWAYPMQRDAVGWAYRTDLFNDPGEQAAFQARYGYPLSVPETWQQLMDIAQFFTRPGEGRYGVAVYTQREHDALVTGFGSVLYAWGGGWLDAAGMAGGAVNGPAAAPALQFYRDLYACCSPRGMDNAFANETNDAYLSGQVAMSMNTFAYFPILANQTVNPYAVVTGFFANPAGAEGARPAALAGQGMSVSAHVSPERQQRALDFIRWFARDDVQMEWSRTDGQTANLAALQVPDILSPRPYDAAFERSMAAARGFPAHPRFGALVEIAQRELHAFVVGGQGSAQEALDAIAAQWQVALAEG